jgi:hypothetical protein
MADLSIGIQTVAEQPPNNPQEPDSGLDNDEPHDSVHVVGPNIHPSRGEA